MEPLSAAEILAIPPGAPERLFSGDPAALRRELTALAKAWHPDRNGGSTEASAVFARVMELHREARRRLAGGTWSAPEAIRVDALDGRSLLLTAKKRHAFELGEMAIATDQVAFLVEKEHAALFEAGLAAIRAIRYPDAKLRRDLARFMPSIEGIYETAERRVAIIPKPADTVLLADLVDYMGALPPKHVAWIVSSLFNLVCFFEVVGLTHNALSAATVFASPQNHAVYPLGGWWYALAAGHRLELLPDASYALLTREMTLTKRADIRLDLECVRAIARAALGDPRGIEFHRRKDLPRPMADFLRLPAPSTALEDYRAWQQALTDSFGPRRFLELPISVSDVYP